VDKEEEFQLTVRHLEGALAETALRMAILEAIGLDRHS